MLDDNLFDSEHKISSIAFQELKATVPWMKLTSIVGLILSSTFLLFGIYLTTVKFGLTELGTQAIIYSIAALVLGFTFFYLLHYAIQLGQYVKAPDPHLLESAMEKQKVFWIIFTILVTILTIMILIALYRLYRLYQSLNMFY